MEGGTQNDAILSLTSPWLHVEFSCPPPCFRWGPVQATMPMTHRTVPLMEKGMEGPQATIEAMAGAPMVSM
jgi:hypothetical protein